VAIPGASGLLAMTTAICASGMRPAAMLSEMATKLEEHRADHQKTYSLTTHRLSLDFDRLLPILQGILAILYMVFLQIPNSFKEPDYLFFGHWSFLQTA
jgi:hypothetical protein